MHRRTVAALLAGTMLAHWLWVDVPVGGAAVASLVLLTTWLSGTRPPDWRLGALVAETTTDPATPEE